MRVFLCLKQIKPHRRCDYERMKIEFMISMYWLSIILYLTSLNPIPLFLWRHSARIRSKFAESYPGSPEGTYFNGCETKDEVFILATVYIDVATKARGMALF